MLSVNEELERLVKVGELARVDYKGSASFRIVNKDQANGANGGKQKRKKKNAVLANPALVNPNVVNIPVGQSLSLTGKL